MAIAADQPLGSLPSRPRRDRESQDIRQLCRDLVGGGDWQNLIFHDPSRAPGGKPMARDGSSRTPTGAPQNRKQFQRVGPASGVSAYLGVLDGVVAGDYEAGR
jgi:hypothetical protein